jgi:hypothetical protein
VFNHPYARTGRGCRSSAAPVCPSSITALHRIASISTAESNHHTLALAEVYDKVTFAAMT